MPSVRVKDSEPFDIALRRFKRTCEKSGLMTDLRKREYFEKPAWKRKRRAAAAKKRLQKKLSRETIAPLRAKGAKRVAKKVRRHGR